MIYKSARKENNKDMFELISTIIESALGFGGHYYEKSQKEIEFDAAYDEFNKITKKIKNKDYKDCGADIRRQKELLLKMERLNNEIKNR